MTIFFLFYTIIGIAYFALGYHFNKGEFRIELHRGPDHLLPYVFALVMAVIVIFWPIVLLAEFFIPNDDFNNRED